MQGNYAMGHALLTPAEVKHLMDSGDAVLIDVREPEEFKNENIKNALNIPLSSIAATHFDAFKGKTLVFHCRSGMRSNQACSALNSYSGQVVSMDGGIEAWKNSGLEVNSSVKFRLPLMRQVQLAIGLFIIFGVGLTYFVHHSFLLIPLVMGAGLVNAGATGWCGLAKIMGTMPWNK